MKFVTLEQVSRPAIFSKSVEVGQNFVTQPVSRWTSMEITTMCREDTAMRDDPEADAKKCTGRQHHLWAHPRRKDYFTVWTIWFRNTDQFLQ